MAVVVVADGWRVLEELVVLVLLVVLVEPVRVEVWVRGWAFTCV